MAATAQLEALRAQIRALEGGAPVQKHRESSGVGVIDELLGGLPRPGIVEVCGALGSGRVLVAGSLLAEATRRRRAVVWVDPLRRLYPPALAELGVELDRLLIVPIRVASLREVPAVYPTSKSKQSMLARS